MKKQSIPFDAAHSDEITQACREVEGKASSRIFWWQWGEAGLAEVEEALENLPKKHRAGAHAVLESGNRVPNSYGYSAQATYVQIIWRNGRWVLDRAWRDYAKSASHGKNTGRHVVRIYLTQQQADEMARSHHAANRICVTEAAQAAAA